VVKSALVDPSSQFYQRFTCAFFVQNLSTQQLQSCVLGWKFFGTKILAQNGRIKCWWNWLLESITLRYSQEAISMVHTCSSRGNFESSIMQENFNFNLKKRKTSACKSCITLAIFYIKNFNFNLKKTRKL